MNPLRTAAFALAVIVPLCACAPGGDQAHAPASSASIATWQTPANTSRARHVADIYANPAWAFRIEVPQGWIVHRGFSQGYLANGAWKTYAAPGSQGTPIVALVLPGSDRITSAEIRIGASRDANEIQNCSVIPEAVRPGNPQRARVGNADFTAFEASDAAMSHYLTVHSYRAVHEGACYALDLLVYGVNPQVYSPPAKPPFATEQAFARMQAVLQTFRFTR
jgi:hypothetical protein